MSSHIYVVDDDDALGRLARTILRTDGLEVESYRSSVEALAKIEDEAVPNPAAIVLDLNMPEVDGREFYRRARQAGYTSPVLILSAYGAHEAQRELGADAALAKPFDPDDLVDTVKSLLSPQAESS